MSPCFYKNRGFKILALPFFACAFRFLTSCEPFVEGDTLAPVDINAYTIELLSPLDSATMDNGCYNQTNAIEWFFDWADYPGAQGYNIYVIHFGSSIPVIDEVVPLSEYHFSSISYITNGNRTNWIWRVRAKVDNQWTNWSNEKVFNVEPLDTDCP